MRLPVCGSAPRVNRVESCGVVYEGGELMGVQGDAGGVRGGVDVGTAGTSLAANGVRLVVKALLDANHAGAFSARTGLNCAFCRSGL